MSLRKEAMELKESLSFLSPELVKIQGDNDRQYLTHRVKLLLEAKEKYPHASFEDIAHLADLTACGCGCCCCCNAIALPGSNLINPITK